MIRDTGGVLLLADGDWIVYDQHKKLVEPFKWWESITTGSDELTALEEDARGRSWYAGWLDFFGNLTRSKEYRPIEELVKNAEKLSILDSSHYLSPINWPGEGIENGAALGQVLNINQRVSYRFLLVLHGDLSLNCDLQNFFIGAKDIALRAGLSREMIDIWGRHYTEEIDHGHLYNVWHYITAQK